MSVAEEISSVLLRTVILRLLDIDAPVKNSRTSFSVVAPLSPSKGCGYSETTVLLDKNRRESAHKQLPTPMKTPPAGDDALVIYNVTRSYQYIIYLHAECK